MYKGEPQGDGKYPGSDQDFFANIFNAQDEDHLWELESNEKQQSTNILGTKKVLTRKGNHIGESMNLSDRRQKILDQSLTAALQRLENQFEDFSTNNSSKSNR